MMINVGKCAGSVISILFVWSILPATCVLAQNSWELIDKGPICHDIYDQAIAYDSSRHVLVLFLALDTDGDIKNETWEWDGSQWHRRWNDYTSSENIIVYAELVFDYSENELLLISGTRVLKWEGNSWTEITICSGPVGLQYPLVAYDQQNSQIVLFGGYYPALFFFTNDTWLWDGNGWILQPPQNKPPISSKYTISSCENGVLLYNCDSRQTWIWDGSDWEIQDVSSDKPSVRQGSAMAYDSSRNKVVLFGGWESSGSYLNDTWEWDGSGWTQKSPVSSSPPFFSNLISYDEDNEYIVSYGAEPNDIDVGYAKNSIFAWDGQGWNEISQIEEPLTIDLMKMVYDSYNNTLFYNDVYCIDNKKLIWRLNGSSWLSNIPTDFFSTRAWYCLAFDSFRNKIVLFGGSDPSYNALNETWEWDNERWVDKSPPLASPAARFFLQLVYDAANKECVLFGGEAWQESSAFADFDLNIPRKFRKEMRAEIDYSLFEDTWIWNGSEWIEKTPSGPSPSARSGHAMAYDLVHEICLLFGGWDGQVKNDTWQWDGEEWTRLYPSVSPSPRDFAAMTYSSRRGRIILFGGIGIYGETLSDLWEWNGYTKEWKLLSAHNVLQGRVFHGLTEAPDGEILLYGGHEAASNYWLYTPDANAPVVLTHDPVSTGLKGFPLVITAQITNPESSEGETALGIIYYRDATSGEYSKSEMTNIVGDSYQATIPASQTTQNTVQYYIEATDRIAGTASSGSMDSPYNVSLSEICAKNYDVNIDGSITPGDALLAFQHYLGLIILENQCSLYRADANGDGVITPGDALIIFRSYLGLE